MVKAHIFAISQRMAKPHLFAISQLMAKNLCRQLADGKEVGLVGRYSSVIHWAPPTSLPSASRRKRFFAICWQMAKRWVDRPLQHWTPTHLFAICWQMAKIICHPLADGKELADGNHVLCRLSVLCHLFFISRWQRRSLPSAGRWQRAG